MEIAKLVNKRIWRGDAYCIGQLYLNGGYICDILEPPYRGLTRKSTLAEIKTAKSKGKTAIPPGVYTLDLRTVSPKFGGMAFYKRVCQGKLPRLCNVPGYVGVLFHCGRTVDHTEACQIVGYNKVKGQVLDSQAAFEKLMGLLKKYTYATYEVI